MALGGRLGQSRITTPSSIRNLKTNQRRSSGDGNSFSGSMLDDERQGGRFNSTGGLKQRGIGPVPGQRNRRV